MAGEIIELFHVEYLFADFLSTIIIFFGTIFLMGFLKNFVGQRFKQSAVMIGTGIILFALLHEFGEFVCRSGIHGGLPKTFFGSAHIVFLGSVGSLVFFAGCYLLQKRYLEYLKE